MSKSAKSKNYALEQVRRLKAKPFYPVADTEEDGKKINHGERELARTLFEYSSSDEHMRRTIDAAVIRSFGDGGQDRCPGPSDLWQLCREINPVQVKAVVIDQNCPECSGYGFTIVKGAHGLTGATSCPRGCAVAGYQGNHDRVSKRTLADWYKRELAGAEARRRSHNARQIPASQRGAELLRGFERMAGTGRGTA